MDPVTALAECAHLTLKKHPEGRVSSDLEDCGSSRDRDGFRGVRLQDPKAVLRGLLKARITKSSISLPLNAGLISRESAALSKR